MASQDHLSAQGLRVVVADSHHLVRRGLAEVLTSAGAIVAQAQDAESALREVVEVPCQRPDGQPRPAGQ